MGEKGRFGTGRGTLAAGREELARRLRLTLVISGEEARPRTIGELAEKAFAGGATALQLREKSLAGREHYGLARDLAAFCRERGRLFIVNDRLYLALASGADGLHLGQGDLPARVARAHWPEGKILGISASTVGEARAAR
jgi:thiamine-phosphate diphosphorylase